MSDLAECAGRFGVCMYHPRSRCFVPAHLLNKLRTYVMCVRTFVRTDIGAPYAAAAAVSNGVASDGRRTTHLPTYVRTYVLTESATSTVLVVQY